MGNVNLKKLSSIRKSKQDVGSVFEIHKCTILSEINAYVRRGDSVQLSSIIRENIKNKELYINETDREQLTALHHAVRYNKFECVKILVELAKADLNLPSSTGMTVMHFAALYYKNTDAQISLIGYLASKGANPNKIDGRRRTPLHYAVIQNNKTAVHKLLQLHNIRKDPQDDLHMTPLHWASKQNHFEICKLLLKSGSNLLTKDEYEFNPFDVACREGHIKIVKLMIENAERKTDGLKELLFNLKAIDFSIENNNHEVTKFCLEKYSEIQSIEWKRPALHLAASCGSMEIIKMLVLKELDLNGVNEHGLTAMHILAEKNHVDIIEYLIENKANIECRNKDWFTPFLMAAKEGHLETLRVLMGHGCDIFVTTNEGKSGLYLAVERNHSAVIKAILTRKDSAKLLLISDSNNNYPLHIACKNGNEEIVRILFENNTKSFDKKNHSGKTLMHLAAGHGSVELIKFLEQKCERSSFNDKDFDLNTPLHFAAGNGNHKVISVLLDLGAFVNCENSIMWTPLNYASSRGHLKAVEVLLERSAKINVKGRFKVAPLFNACKNGHVEVVTLLIKKGAKVMKKFNDGQKKSYTALDIAIDNGHRDCVSAILNTSDWEDILNNQTISSSGHIDTPILKLIRVMPELAKIVFDKCITYNIQSDANGSKTIYKMDFLEEIQMNYKELQKIHNAFTQSIEDHPLMVMVEYERELLLNHELVRTFISKKWNSYGQYIYIINLSIFTLFLCSLLTYMMQAVPPYQYYLRNKIMGLDGTTCIRVQKFIVGEQLNDVAVICKYLVFVLGSFCLIKEAIQVIINKRKYLNLENLLELMFYLLSFSTVIDTSSCQKNIGVRESWQWQTGTVASLLGIIIMILFIRKIPFFGICVIMFTDVMWTFIKFLPLFFLFIFTYAFAFFTLLNNQIPFNNLGNSLIKTTVMTIGEMDFNEIFNSNLGSGTLDNQLIFYDHLTYIIFVIFLIMMSIVTMNLLSGLAVDDIRSIREKANLKRHSMKVRLLLEIEYFLPKIFRRKKLTTLHLGLKGHFNIWRKLFGINALSTNNLENTDSYEKEIDEKLNSINLQYIEIHTMLRTLLKSRRSDSKEASSEKNN